MITASAPGGRAVQTGDGAMTDADGPAAAWPARLVFATAGGLATTTVLPLEADGDIWRPCP